MKKVLLTILITIVALNSIAFSEENNYITVKIAQKPNLDFNYTVNSELGFDLLRSNESVPFLFIDKNSIRVSKDQSTDVFNVFEDNGSLIISIPTDGSVYFKPKGINFSTETAKYRGSLSFLLKGSNIIIINRLPLEEYLYGVVPKEMSPSSHIEALKAQAIAARSYAYANINRHSSEGYNVCATEHCQVYGGLNAEHINTNTAIDETKNLVVKFNGSIASTVFHASSGGHTESSQAVWGGVTNYLLPVFDIYSNVGSHANWEVRLSSLELSQRMLEAGVDIKGVKGITINETSPSGRVTKLTVNGSDNNIQMTGARLRTILGGSRFKSTLFTVGSNGFEQTDTNIIQESNKISPISQSELSVITKDGIELINQVPTIITNKGIRQIEAQVISATDDIVFKGKGYGHGVGMSQQGAIEMAKQGFTYDQIIKFYYTGVEIETY